MSDLAHSALGWITAAYNPGAVAEPTHEGPIWLTVAQYGWLDDGLDDGRAPWLASATRGITPSQARELAALLAELADIAEAALLARMQPVLPMMMQERIAA